ncbi:SAV_2336 N-terminal domain-related protein [Streptomyces sp. NPDC093250]|uniref:SAV_2336 N-terminal domain-related protein n=1 Tax=Streptomyces sp. NPDC093250 TaxID=3366036 RepID=UPI003820411E
MSEQNSGIGRLGALLSALNPESPSPTPREIAELIWLARSIPEGTAGEGWLRGDSALPALPSAPPRREIDGSTALLPGRADETSQDSAEEVCLYLPGDKAPNDAREGAERASAVRVSGTTALPRRRALARALRPLKRHVPSPMRTVLDEDATADGIADDGRWIPVLVPAKDRWLDATLIIDACGDCADLWDPLGRELRQVLQELGAFRDVRTYWLRRGEDGRPALAASTHPFQPLRSPASAIDPTGRTVTLVLTDGVAPTWRTPALQGALRHWATTGPTAILQTLPEHLWERTALAPEPGRFHNTAAGAPNLRLRYSPYALWSGTPKSGEVPVPVLGIEPEWLAPWAQAVADTGAFDGAAVRLLPAGTRDPARLETIDAPSGQQVSFEDFLAQAQPRVFRLAAYLAAAPLNLAVMRLVQSAMLPDSPSSDLAEIVFSGLVRRMPDDDADALQCAYDFAPGVRQRLLSTLRRDEADAVVAAVSAYVDHNAAGSTARFTAAVADPEGPLLLSSGAQHWAAVRNVVRQRQGRVATHTVERAQGAEASVDTGDRTQQSVTLSASAVPSESSHPGPTSTPTIAVLTALPVEYDAVRAYLVDTEALVHDDGTWVERGRLDGTAWSVAIAEVGEGTVNAAALTTQIVGWLRPEVLLFVGVAGGLKGDIEIGDVVVGTKVYALHGGKHTPEGLPARPEAWRASHRLVQAARSALRDMEDVRCHLKPIVCGDIVPADDTSAFADNIRRTYNDAYAIEIEGSGAAHAANLSRQLDALVIRGISDKADTNKPAHNAENPQVKAAKNAAMAAVAMLRELPPREVSRYNSEPAPEYPDVLPPDNGDVPSLADSTEPHTRWPGEPSHTRIVMIASSAGPALAGSSFRQLGTGFLLGPRLILTAAHVLRGRSQQETLRVYNRRGTVTASGWVDCRVLWTHDAHDAALLLTEEDIAEPATNSRFSAPRWGHLTGDAPLSPVHVTGVVIADEESPQASGHLTGTLHPASSHPDAAYEFEPAVLPPLLRTSKSLPRGISGAPVFSGEFLLGFVIAMRRERAGRLHFAVASISSLVNDQGFSDACSRYLERDIRLHPASTAPSVPTGDERASGKLAERRASRVFISYAHADDGGAHAQQVRSLWELLQAQGIDARLDQVGTDAHEDWAAWMRDELEAADFVLVVASPDYKRRAENPGADSTIGVAFEARLLRNELTHRPAMGIQRILPVVLPGSTNKDLPSFVEHLAPITMSTITLAGAEQLLHHLAPRPSVPDLSNQKTMNSSYYRRQLERKNRECFAAEKRAGELQAKAATKRAAATRARAAAAKSRNASTIRSRTREADRYDVEANTATRDAARWSTKAASLAKEAGQAQVKLTKAEQSERAAAERARQREQLAADRRATAEQKKIQQRLDVTEQQVGLVLREMRAPKLERLRVLMLGASSEGDLRVGREQSRIRAAVERALHRDLVDLDVRPAATAADLLDGITRFRPHVVHFSGHSTAGLIVFERDVDLRHEGAIVTAAAFARAITATDDPPLLVLLNSCQSAAQIGDLIGTVPFAIGMSDEIGDTDAIHYAAQFYAAVANGQSVAAAHASGQAAVELAGLPDHDLPTLVHAADVDPRATFLVKPPQ